MKQENKTKSVKKFSIKMLLAMVFGGVLGGFFGVFMVFYSGTENFIFVQEILHKKLSHYGHSIRFACQIADSPALIRKNRPVR
mgnify:CR=1 FL=1